MAWTELIRAQYERGGRSNGLLREINQRLVEAARLGARRAASPTAGVIDSQSVKSTENGGICGHDAGKRIKGRKRRIVTDTVGLLVGLVIHGADVQDRDGRIGMAGPGWQDRDGRTGMAGP